MQGQETNKATPDEKIAHQARTWREVDRDAIANKQDPQKQRAEYRARLIESALAPRLLGKKFASPAAAFEDLTKATAVLAIQSGEPGPIACAAAQRPPRPHAARTVP